MSVPTTANLAFSNQKCAIQYYIALYQKYILEPVDALAKIGHAVEPLIASLKATTSKNQRFAAEALGRWEIKGL